MKKGGNVWWFFLSAISFTWIFQLPATLHSNGIAEVPSFVLSLARYLPAFGPFVAAFFLTYLYERKDGVKRLIQRGWNININKKWWLPILFLLPAMELTAILSATIFGGDAFPELPVFTKPYMFARTFLSLLYLAALEEYGWRGYALDRLQRKWNALVSSLIIAIFWGIWHFQQWFMGVRDVPFLAFWYGILMESILLTWIYNNTKRSLLPVIIVHTLMNAELFSPWSSVNSAWIYVLIWTLVTITVLIGWGPRTLTRLKANR